MMKVSVTTLPLSKLDVNLLLLPVVEGAARETAENIGGAIGEALELALADFSGKLGESVLVYPGASRAQRVAFVGLGPEHRVDSEGLREAAAAGAVLAKRTDGTTAAIRVPTLGIASEVMGQALVEGFVLASYEFRRYRTDDGSTHDRTERLVLHAGEHEKAVRRGAERGRVIAEATCSARDLVNMSPHEKTPTLLGKAAERLGKKCGFEVTVWDKAAIEDEKMGGLLAVNRGSPEPPVFIEMAWQPTNAVNNRPLVLVGKGIVFDTGGLSLKPTKNSMEFMKSDMAGGGAVVGIMEALARLELPLYVVGLVPATDNRPGGWAYVPGDVITMHSGNTAEVLNTDAEGRMVLADGLSYAKIYRPELVVSMATLTGAQRVALGSRVAAVMTNRGPIDDLCVAGTNSGDLVHPLPMHAHYAEDMNSNVADIKNIGTRREAGAIQAAKFLEFFVNYDWLHVDFAGPAFVQHAMPYRPKGATGFGVRLMIEFLTMMASARKR